MAFAALSLIALDFVWLRVLYVGIHQLLGRGSLQQLQRERHIFHSQLGAYMASLLVSNLLSRRSELVGPLNIGSRVVGTVQVVVVDADLLVRSWSGRSR